MVSKAFHCCSARPSITAYTLTAKVQVQNSTIYEMPSEQNGREETSA